MRNARQAEKEHVKKLHDTEYLLSKPFLGGTSLSTEKSRVEISIFTGMLASLPRGPGSTILDLGAGACWISEWLQKLHYKTISLDICHDMLRIGKQRLQPQSRLCVADMTAIPLANETVDAAMCYGALHHVPNWQRALSEIYRVLRPGGVLILQEPGKGHSRQTESITQMQQFGVLEQDMPPSTLRRACRQAGFSHVIIRPIAELSFGLIRVLPRYYPTLKAPKLSAYKYLKRIQADIIENLLNIISPMHIVVAAKGKPYTDSTCPYTMTAHFDSITCPTIIKPGQTSIPINLKITNTGMTRWLARNPDGPLGQVKLGVSLFRSISELTDLDYARVDLPHDVEPGKTIEINANIPTPPGINTLFRFDLVSEGIAWFSEKGSKPVFRNCVIQH